MQTTIPVLTIVFMAISALIGVAIPAALYLFFHKRMKANHLPFWVGCITFVLFAFVLEQAAYYFVMKLPLWATITGNVWLYSVVGGLFAGVFEETGRFVAFKTVLRKKRANDANALMYGAGHGGIEAVILLSATMIGNLIYVLQFNAGSLPAGVTLDAMQTLVNTPSWMFLVGSVERFSAVALHISLSVLVWFAAKNAKRFWLYPLAIFLHLLVDAAAGILSGFQVNVWVIEGVVIAITIALVVLAVFVWKKNHAADQPESWEEILAVEV